MPPSIEVDIKELFDKLDRKLDNLSKDVADIKISVARLEEGDKRLEDKIDNLGKRMDNQEFISRGIVIGLVGTIFATVLTFLATLLKMFGLLNTP